MTIIKYVICAVYGGMARLSLPNLVNYRLHLISCYYN